MFLQKGVNIATQAKGEGTTTPPKKKKTVLENDEADGAQKQAKDTTPKAAGGAKKKTTKKEKSKQRRRRDSRLEKERNQRNWTALRLRKNRKRLDRPSITKTVARKGINACAVWTKPERAAGWASYCRGVYFTRRRASRRGG